MGSTPNAWDENKQLVASFTDYGPNDVLIVAGDVAEDLDVLRDTLTTLAQVFGHVFYITGNNELRLNKTDKYKTSFHKREAAMEIAQSIPNVYIEPREIHGVWIVPLHCWYEPTLDSEYDNSTGFFRRWRDFRKCYWGSEYHNEHGHPDLPNVCKEFLNLNSRFIKKKEYVGKPVITYSHFLPRRDLLPSKIWLKDETMPYVAGSPGLEKQIRKLKPLVHVFGHSHLNVDKEVNGVKYVQNAMAHPRERNSWLRIGQGKYQPKCIFHTRIAPTETISEL